MASVAVYPETVVRAVIFDWFGTLAEWPHGSTSSYTSVFSDHGHLVDPAVFDRYQSGGTGSTTSSTRAAARRTWPGPVSG